VLCICSIAAVLLAEVVHHYFPKYVELHNYSAANSVRQKLYNWSTLNREWAAQAGSARRRSARGSHSGLRPAVLCRR